MIVDLARTATDENGPVEYVFLGLMFLVATGGMALTVIRMRRGRRPRDEQMRRLAAMLDGRGSVAVRMAEIGLNANDLALVAHSRGYLVVPHTVMKYYEFVYAPHRIPVYGRPWQR